MAAHATPWPPAWVESWHRWLTADDYTDTKLDRFSDASQWDKWLELSSASFAALLDGDIAQAPRNVSRGDAAPAAATNWQARARPIDSFAPSTPPVDGPMLPEGLRRLLTARLGLHPMEFALVVLPAHFRLPPSRLHTFLADRRASMLGVFCPMRMGKRLALAAPRGAAKSTWCSLVFPLHDLLYQQERYILLIAATLEQATRRLEQIRGELKHNPVLGRLFPGLAEEIKPARRSPIYLGESRLDARSIGTELRGLTHKVWRPTKLVLDDAEPQSVGQSARVRQRLREWFHDVIEPLGDRFTHLDIVGTLLHPESLLARLLEAPTFDGRKYASIASWSPREDLWQQWRAMRNARRLDDAAALLEFNRDAMLGGTDVLWPEREDYVALMEQLDAMGRRAFLKEKQNEPRFLESAAFAPDGWVLFFIEGRTLRIEAPGGWMRSSTDKPTYEAQTLDLEELTMIAYLDPATGAANGDDAAIVVLGVTPKGDRLLLLDVWMEPAPPSEQVRMVWALHEKWGFGQMWFEKNGFQEMLHGPIEDARQQRRKAGKSARLIVQGKRNTKNKKMRISALEPILASGELMLSRALPNKFYAQLEQWPTSDHDDALDALAAAVEQAKDALGASLTGLASISRRGIAF